MSSIRSPTKALSHCIALYTNICFSNTNTNTHTQLLTCILVIENYQISYYKEVRVCLCVCLASFNWNETSKSISRNKLAHPGKGPSHLLIDSNISTTVCTDQKILICFIFKANSIRENIQFHCIDNTKVDYTKGTTKITNKLRRKGR